MADELSVSERTIASVMNNQLRRAVWFDETFHVMDAYLKKVHGCKIIITDKQGCVVQSTGGFKLFNSPSYTSCLEYALAMPLIKDEP